MILVTGATGFVGGEIMKNCNNVIAAPSLRGVGEDDVKRIIEENEITAVIHTAAISDIGECEKDPDASYYANVQIPIYLARASKDLKLVCFSSDQVYTASEGEGPYTEDMAKPANVYARHKLEMETRVLDIKPDAVMLRAEWMYGYYLKKSNYIMNILNASDSITVPEQYRGITYIKEVTENMERVCLLPGGVYNFGSEADRSMPEITAELLASLGKPTRVLKSSPRHNLWMSCDAAAKYGVTFSSVSSALLKCARDLQLIK